MQSKPLFTRAPGDDLNFMDEVSNELDIPTLAILEDYLNSFVGIVILVSHDRYFLDNTVDRIFAFDGDGHFRQYEGGYTDYLEARKREKAENSGADFEGREGGRQKAAGGRGAGDKASGKGNAGGKPTWDKGEKKLKFTYKEQKEFETIEDDIAALEEKIAALDKDIEASAHDFVKLNQLMAEKEDLEAVLEEKMERWMYLEELAAKIAAQ